MILKPNIDQIVIYPYQNLLLRDIKGEEWRDIKGYEDYYMVSNMGRVKSLARRVKCRGNKTKWNCERILKQGVGNRVMLIILNRKGDRKSHTVSTLVRNVFLKEVSIHKIKFCPYY